MEKQNQNISHQPIKNQRAMIQECIENCLNCFQSCTEVLNHCVSLGGKHVEPHHLRLLQSCAVICEASAKVLMMESEYYSDVCKLCADVCMDCALDCNQISDGDEMMDECAEFCRICADSCNTMITH
jgi:hypothetical protein